MAQPANAAPDRSKPGPSSLRQRILSALVLIPVVLALAYLGHPYWTGLVVVFGGTMAWEWARISGRRRSPADPAPAARLPISDVAPEVLVSVTVAIACIVAWAFPNLLPNQDQGQYQLPAPNPAWVLLPIGALIATLAALPRHGFRALWFGLGTLYVVLPCWAILSLRAGGHGLETLVWILGIVIAADTGAYAAGRTIGGPKLAPRISPSKTWAGLGGAVVSACLIGLIAAYALDRSSIWPMALGSAVLAVFEQLGDLTESAFKRHFGVKDSSRIIPGHGGVLDRVDGLLAVTVIVAVIEFEFLREY